MPENNGSNHVCFLGHGVDVFLRQFRAFARDQMWA